jgi:polysaccharide chain length determinant protein (PEP-CTERM system associated)
MLPGKRYTFDDVARIGWRGKWFLLGPAILTSMVAATYLRFVPDVYRAETTILVVAQRVPTDIIRSTVTSNVQDRLRSIQQQILSRTRLEPIVLDLNLYSELRQRAPMEDVIEVMRREVEVTTIRGDAFTVAYRSETPILAQQVAERLASLFIEESMRDREVQAEATSQFLESQLNEARQKLIEHEKRLEAFRLRNAGQLPTQVANNVQVVQTLNLEAQGLSDSLDRDRDRKALVERSLTDLAAQAKLDPSGDPTPSQPSDPGPAPGSAAAELATARETLRALKTRLTPEHPDVARGERIVAELERKARAEREAAVIAAAAGGPVSASTAGMSTAERQARSYREELALLNKNIASKETRLEKVQAEITQYRGRIETVPVLESELTELMRDYTTLQSTYQSLLAKRQEAQIASNVERRQIGEQFRVLDPARRPEKPYSPNRPLIQAIGTLLGLGIGIGILALMEVRDKTLRKESDVLEALNLPVLATVPRMRNAEERRRARRQLLGLSSAAAAGVAVAVAIAWSWMR